MKIPVSSFCLFVALICRAAIADVIDVSRSEQITEAIAHAKPGDTVRIAVGEYKFSKPIKLENTGRPDAPIRIVSSGPQRAVFDFSAEAEENGQFGIEISGDYYGMADIEVAHAGNHGIQITGGNNTLERCVARENRSSGFELNRGAHDNLIFNCESYLNFDPKTKGEDADGFACKHVSGTGNIFRACRSFQNADDGWDLWMTLEPVLIEDCVAYRNGFGIFGITDFQGDGNGFKLGGNYVGGAHILRRCVSIENPLHGFDQNHNSSGMTLEDCVAIRCGKGFGFPEVPQSGQNVLRRNTSFGCGNILERHMISEGNRWLADIATGPLGPPPRPGHRDIAGAGKVPTTQEEPNTTPGNAPPPR